MKHCLYVYNSEGALVEAHELASWEEANALLAKWEEQYDSTFTVWYKR